MNWKSRSTWVTIITTAFIAWALNRVLDMTVSGAPHLLNKLLFVITLGSATVRDAPYVSAALNPYPLTPVLIASALSYAVSLFLGIGTGFLTARKYGFRGKRQNKAINGEQVRMDVKETRSLWKKYGVPLTFFIIPIAVLSAALVPFGIVSQAVLARRVYEADRDIVTPYLTRQQLAELQAEFCSITTKAQYQALMGEIRSIAVAHHTKLRDEGI
jgi:uncharacterized protein YneF (UPF0154 family)